MEWRCKWCGKPHEEDDPPCDSCGHGSFEKAVVRVPDTETVDTGTTYVWVCPDCGKEHVRNSPPCSRCGSPDLEKREQSYGDLEDDLAVSSYAELAKPYLPIVAAVLVLAALVATGVVPVPSIGPLGGPSMPDADGHADQYGEMDLGEVESAVLEGLADERRERGVSTPARDDTMDDVATYINRNQVREYRGKEPTDEGALDVYDPSCDSRTVVAYPIALLADGTIDEYEDEADLAETIVGLMAADPGDDQHLFSSHSVEGIDFHVGPDGAVYGYYVAC